MYQDSDVEQEGNTMETNPETEMTDLPEAEPESSMPEITSAPVAESSRWSWIGSPDRPEAKEHSDGISDLFTVTDEDVESSDEALSDLTDVDIEKDILDSDDDGSLDDLVSVTEEDIMGDEMGQRPSKPASQQRRRALPKYRRTSLRYIPPTSLGRSG